MRSHLRRGVTATVIFFVVLMLLYPVTAYCSDDRSYYMSSFKVNAQLNGSGDMSVLEEITYEFDGSFGGVYRTLKTAGSDGIESIEVYRVWHGKLFEFERYDSGADRTYQLIEEGDGIRLKIFSPAQDESKTFVIKYKVKNVATRYKDVGELYWKFMGHDTEVKIDNFEVRIRLPEGADKEDIKVFGHGPLSGISQIIDSKNVELRVEELPPHNFVEARVLFPPSLIKYSWKIVDREALAGIMAEEQGLADKANARRVRARIAVGLSFAYVLFELFMIVYLYSKYDKEYKTGFTGEYFRELPGRYSPAVMSVLWNFGGVKPRDITATMMDLVRRKHLKLKVERREIRGFLKNKVEEEYVFELNKEADSQALSPHEKYLIDWLISTIGNGVSVSLDEIEQSSGTRREAQSFKEHYDDWVKSVKTEAGKLNFFDKNTVKGNIMGVLAAVIGVVFGWHTAAAYDNTVGFIALIIFSLILFIYSLTIRKRSRDGALQFKKWKAFRRFLTHFSRIDRAELPSVILWEHYLVYAITLGVAKEVISQLRLVFREDDFKDSSLTYMYYGRLGYSYRHFDAIDKVTDTMVSTTESVYKQAISKMSSGSGKGGGFSGGGGGGGGGGGAGAF